MISERQQAMLDFERSAWNLEDPKDLAIRARFHCSSDEYYAELNDLIEQPEAMAHDPLVVRRLQRHRLRRLRERLDGKAAGAGQYGGLNQ